MRISSLAIERCEPLFDGFIDEMNSLELYRSKLFKDGVPEANLFSETLRLLTLYHSDRARGAYCLLVNGLVWDAEVIIRTLYEAVAKVLLLATAVPDARQRLATEYWTTLSAIYDKKGSDRARIAERLAGRVNSGDKRVFTCLSDPDIFEIEPVVNRTSRKEIEQRWSFSKIVQVLTKGDPNHIRVRSLDALFHPYGLASHLAHASPRALDLMHDRATRGEDLLPLEVAHVCQMLSDMVSLTCFSLHQSNRAITGEENMSAELRASFTRMTTLIGPYRREFGKSQDELYGKWENKSSL